MYKNACVYKTFTIFTIHLLGKPWDEWYNKRKQKRKNEVDDEQSWCVFRYRI